MRFSFTASQHVSGSDWQQIGPVLSALTMPNVEFTTGACIGGDFVIGVALTLLHPDAHHRVVVPANRKKVIEWWKAIETPVEVIEMPDGTTYRDRNKRLLDFGEQLIAFPQYDEEDGSSKRSGTWMTIRLARGRKIPVTVRQLSGDRL